VAVGDLYQDLILDHSKSPRNYRAMEDPDRSAEGVNPLCGDEVTLFLKLEGDTIRDITFQGSGCAISKASASVMTTVLKGKTIADAERLFEGFHDMVTGKPVTVDLGKLAAFQGVAAYPARVKCASLVWHTLHDAIGDGAPAAADSHASHVQGGRTPVPERGVALRPQAARREPGPGGSPAPGAAKREVS
jgi:nitrogen fixation NifU-like protein